MSTATVERQGISQEGFVSTWVRAHIGGQSAKEVAETLGMTVNAVYARRNGYVKKGINLPDLKSAQRRERTNKDALNDLIQKMLDEAKAESETSK